MFDQKTNGVEVTFVSDMLDAKQVAYGSCCREENQLAKVTHHQEAIPRNLSANGR